jgi:hypothetical protein
MMLPILLHYKIFMDSAAMSKIKQSSRACAGNGCPNEGILQLTVIYLNRIGWFCNSCKDDLIKDGLIFEVGASIAPEPELPATGEPNP